MITVSFLYLILFINFLIQKLNFVESFSNPLFPTSLTLLFALRGHPPSSILFLNAIVGVIRVLFLYGKIISNGRGFLQDQVIVVHGSLMKGFITHRCCVG